MKIFTLIFVFILLQPMTGDAQTPQTHAVSSDKATVYFVRISAIGAVVNFKYFVDDEYVGSFNYGRYLVAEIDPGEHVIWAKSDNYDFINANLEAGKTYVVDSRPIMGAFVADVKLLPVMPTDSKRLQKAKKHLANKKLEPSIAAEEQSEIQAKKANVIGWGLEKYEMWKSKNRDLKMLDQPVEL